MTVAALRVDRCCEQNGESYDARREQPGWSTAAFKPPPGATPWVPAAVVPSADAPRGVMVAWSAPPITITRCAELAARIFCSSPSERVFLCACRVTAPVKIWKNAGPAVATCGHVPEGAPLVLQCPPQQAVDRVEFASYGTPQGRCGSNSGQCRGTSCEFAKGNCDAAGSMAVIKAACLGKGSCSVGADCHANASSSCAPYGGDPCFMTHKSLAVKVHCAPAADVPPPPTTHTVDFGSNLAGVCRLKGIVGPAGSRVTIRHGEALQHAHLPGLEFPDPDRIYTENLRTAKATDTYVMKGAAGGETWQPTMTYHGFRYVEVTGPSTLTADNIVRWRYVLDLSRFPSR